MEALGITEGGKLSILTQKSLKILRRCSLAPHVVVLGCHQIAHFKAQMTCYILMCSTIIYRARGGAQEHFKFLKSRFFGYERPSDAHSATQEKVEAD